MLSVPLTPHERALSGVNGPSGEEAVMPGAFVLGIRAIRTWMLCINDCVEMNQLLFTN